MKNIKSLKKTFTKIENHNFTIKKNLKIYINILCSCKEICKFLLYHK